MNTLYKNIRYFFLGFLYLGMVRGALAAGGGGAGQSTSLTNPIASVTFKQFLDKVIDVILIFALPLIVIFIMYAGFLFVTAQGEPAQISKARTALTWAVVGGVIVLGARIISGVINGTASAL